MPLLRLRPRVAGGLGAGEVRRHAGSRKALVLEHRRPRRLDVRHIRQQQPNARGSQLAAREFVQVRLHLLALELLEPSILLAGGNFPLKLRLVRELHRPQGHGQLVLPPEDLAPLRRLDDAEARHGDATDVAPDLLAGDRAGAKPVPRAVVLLLLPLHHPLRRRRVLRAEVLGDAGGSLNGVAFQALYCGVRGHIVKIPQNHGTRDRRGLLLALLARQPEGHLCEGQEL
mmetsp:Transcript_48563/g.141432  ORF Transcript_48563/g.141432 Transcript_48563/m.141432 type:complete len:229 (+) Transcript_48563:670-1356(+)